MLSNNSPVGSLVSAEAYILWISNSITKEKISSRKEFYAITTAGLLFKGTVWSKLSEKEINSHTWMTLRNFKVNDFKGKGIASFGPSDIFPSDSTCQVPDVVEIFGGIGFESLPTIRSNTQIGKPYWCFISGKLSSFDHCIHYT